MKRLFPLLALVAAMPAPAQQPPLRDPLLDNLEGRWVLSGTIGRSATTHDVTAEWVLDHHYLRLHEVSRERGVDGRPAYEAMVFIGWNPASGRYGCVWLDVFGGLTTESIGSAPRDGDRIDFAFENGGRVTLRNTMTWHPDSRSWDWRIVNVEGQRSRVFAEVALRRAQPE